MPGGINTKHFMQVTGGGVHGAGVGIAAWLSGSGSRDVVVFTSPLPAPAADENPGADLTYRAYHRSIGIRNNVDQVGFYAYQNDRIWHLSASPAWTSLHVVASQNAARGSGDHTGLYQVHARDGSRLYVCALYRTTTDTIGWVRFDTLANAWTSGTTTLGSHTTTFGPCAQWNGYLVHAGSSGLIFFDPLTTEVFVLPYPGADLRDWVHVDRGRLFVITRFGDTSLHLAEFVAGGLLDHGAFTGTENGTTEGGWSVWTFSDEVFYVPYYSSTGGTGWRLERVSVPSSVRGAADVVLSDLTNPPIPDGSGPDSPGNYRWPGSAITNGRQMWLSAIDAAEWPRGAFGTTGGSFSGFHLQAAGVGGNKFSVVHLNIGWFGEGALIKTVNFPDPTTNMNGLYSYPVSRYGRGAKDLNGGNGPWIESVEPYSDGTVTRGLLITWRARGQFGARDLQVQYGSPIGRRTGPGFNAAFLSIASGIDLGGTAVLNTPDRTVDEYVAAISDGAGPNAVLQHNTPSFGPGYSVGEAVTGSSSGTVGTVLTVEATKRRVGVKVTSGPGFTAADVITGGASGTIAQLSADQDEFPLYQVVWDLDVDGVADLEWVELSLVSIPATTVRPPGNFSGFIVGPTQVVQIQPQAGNATQTSGPPQDMTTLSDSSTLETAGPPQEVIALSEGNALQTAGPPQEVAALSDFNATEVAGPPQEILAETDLEPSLAQPVAGHPIVKGTGGVIGVQADGVEQGVRPAINFDDPAGIEPGTQGFVGEPLLPAGPKVSNPIKGIFELGRATIDGVNDAVNTTYQLLDMAAAGLTSVGGLFCKARAVDVSGITTPPTISLGTNTPNWDNQKVGTQPAVTANGEVEDASLTTPRLMLGASDVLTARLQAQATATTFVVEVIVYGFEE